MNDARTERLRERLRNMTVERGCTVAEAAAAAKKLADLESSAAKRRVEQLLSSSPPMDIDIEILAALTPSAFTIDNQVVPMKKMTLTNLRRILTSCYADLQQNDSTYAKVRCFQIESELRRRNKK